MLVLFYSLLHHHFWMVVQPLSKDEDAVMELFLVVEEMEELLVEKGY